MKEYENLSGAITAHLKNKHKKLVHDCKRFLFYFKTRSLFQIIERIRKQKETKERFQLFGFRFEIVYSYPLVDSLLFDES